ncbi:PhnD/SsuA/transferrin family substrate-binding protein [Candidatus Sumerlaeota bacterium]|nr:PhnD/SsuA/transferrin family substrate-binding protein [Candidatus Sumerlaeota bacterium]
MLIIMFNAALALLLSARSSSAQEDDPSTEHKASLLLPAPPSAATTMPLKTLTLAYTHVDPSDPMDADWFRALLDDINHSTETQDALRKAGYASIAAAEAEGYRDLIQLLDANQSDIAVCPSVAYIRQKGDYLPVSVIRRSEHYSSRGDGRALLQFCIITRADHPLSQWDAMSEAEIQRQIKEARIACPSSFSATGYVYPLVFLHGKFAVDPDPQQFIYCGSDDAVIKMTATGLADVGFCEYGALQLRLDELKKIGVDPEKALHVFHESNPRVQSDPVIMRGPLASSQDEAVRALRQQLSAAINKHCAQLGQSYAIEETNGAAYDELRQTVRHLDNLREGGTQ